MRLGIGTYTFAWAIGVAGHMPPRPMDAFGLLDEAVRLGVRVVQFCDNLPLTRFTDAELDRFENAVRRSGLSLELGTRGLAQDNLSAHLALCRRFGSPILRLVIDSPGDEPSPEEALARLKPLRADFVASGVRVAIENHDRFSSAVLANLVRGLGTDWAGICLDTVNSFGALEGPEVVLEALGEFTLCLHVKDFTVHRVSHNMGFVIEGCAAGQGRLNVPWLLERLRRATAAKPDDVNAERVSPLTLPSPRGEGIPSTPLDVQLGPSLSAVADQRGSNTQGRQSTHAGGECKTLSSGRGQGEGPGRSSCASVPCPFNAILETWVTPGNSLDETIVRERAWAEAGVRYLRTLIPD